MQICFNKVMNMTLDNYFNVPPKDTPPTHYNTLGGMRTEYLNIGDDWYLLSFGYSKLSQKPQYATPIGEVEPVREVEQVTEKKQPVIHQPREVEYYRSNRGHYVGD